MSQLLKSPERPADMIRYVNQLITNVSASLRSGESSGRIEDVLANLESTDESFYTYVVVGVKFPLCSKQTCSSGVFFRQAALFILATVMHNQEENVLFHFHFSLSFILRQITYLF